MAGLARPGKKAFFFSLTALFLVMLFILVFTAKPKVLKEEDIKASRADTDVLDYYTKSISEIYLDRMLIASSHKAIEVMLANISQTSPPADLTDIEENLKSLMRDGTLLGKAMPAMDGYTLPNLTESVIYGTTEHFQIESDIDIFNIDVWQDDPWRISLRFISDIHTNRSGVAYRFLKKIETNISIEGFEDPLLLYNSSNRTIKRFSKEIFNSTDFQDLIIKGAYRYDARAPSYLMRLANNNSPSGCCGISTILNSSPDFLDGNRNCSYVDYLFINNTCCGSGTDYNIYFIADITNATPPSPFTGVKIDLEHLTELNITNPPYEIKNMCS